MAFSDVGMAARETQSSSQEDDGNAEEEDDETRITSLPFVPRWFRVVSRPSRPDLEGAEINAGVRSGG